MRVTLVSDQYTRDLTRPERTPRLSHCPTLLSWQSHATLWYSMELLLLCWLRVRLGLLSRVNIRGTHEVVVYDDTWPSCETQNLLCHSQPSISATCCWGNVILWRVPVIDNLTSGRVWIWNKYTLDRTPRASMWWLLSLCVVESDWSWSILVDVSSMNRCCSGPY